MLSSYYQSNTQYHGFIISSILLAKNDRQIRPYFYDTVHLCPPLQAASSCQPNQQTEGYSTNVFRWSADKTTCYLT